MQSIKRSRISGYWYDLRIIHEDMTKATKKKNNELCNQNNYHNIITQLTLRQMYSLTWQMWQGRIPAPPSPQVINALLPGSCGYATLQDRETQSRIKGVRLQVSSVHGRNPIPWVSEVEDFFQLVVQCLRDAQGRRQETCKANLGFEGEGETGLGGVEERAHSEKSPQVTAKEVLRMS